ncbi:MAG: hypothetical protein LQ340_007422 [Diploschistes diacapsis]|nr:MAG: hypothetical protein LQ340_007422 [Diploschistes diacapsis]
MNSLNILSAHVIRTPPKPARSRSASDESQDKESSPPQPEQRVSRHSTSDDAQREEVEFEPEVKQEDVYKQEADPLHKQIDEKTRLLDSSSLELSETKQVKRGSHFLIKRIADALTASIKWVVAKIIAPGVYIVSCFYDANGQFSTIMPLRRLRRRPPKQGQSSTAHAVGLSGSSEASGADKLLSEKSSRLSPPRRLSSSTAATSESEVESKTGKIPSRNSKIRREGSSSSDNLPTRRSIRIKLNAEEQARRKRSKKQRTASDVAKSSNTLQEEAAAAAELKSPTSPASSLRITKYPHAPYPPRPLIPRRQPSYSDLSGRRGALAQKTLVIDLDETLIHSMAKGGRMSTGHMVEVKLSSPAAYNGLALGPQHPILYYVHKRPHCDDFLKKISKWYNLVVFTASVQEYADPVIDWLEQERQYFSARYYRQHCTFRNGAYIKDLSSVEPDLSRVMILDNSPLSYIFHEDNAIPIEGWINDPTDNDLLHILPMLEALQYATDVRAFCGLRRGEVEGAE